MKTALNNVVLPTLFNVVNNIVQHCYTWMRANSGLTMLNNIVDNIEQCEQHNIVHGCFHQPWTGCAFSSVNSALGQHSKGRTGIFFGFSVVDIAKQKQKQNQYQWPWFLRRGNSARIANLLRKVAPTSYDMFSLRNFSRLILEYATCAIIRFSNKKDYH